MLGGIFKEVEEFLAANSDSDVQTCSLPGEPEESFERRVEYGVILNHKHRQIKDGDKGGDFIITYRVDLVYFSPSREDQIVSGDIKFSCIKDPDNPERDKGARLGETAREMIYSGAKRLRRENPGIQYKIRPIRRKFAYEEDGNEKVEFVTERNCFYIRMKGALETFIAIGEVEKLEKHIVQEAHEDIMKHRSFTQSVGRG